MTAGHEAPVGTPQRSRRLTLRSMEESAVAAPRLAASLVYDHPLEDSPRVDNLPGEETRKNEKKPGEFLWGVGLVGASLPTADSYAAPGIELTGYYETPRYAFGFSARGAETGNATTDSSFASLSTGGRSFTSDTNFSPFVGGGLELIMIDVDQGDEHVDGSGLGAFGEVGVEMMRLHHDVPVTLGLGHVW